jgi:hypothetical protein
VGLVWFCGEGGLEEDLEEFYSIWWVCNLELEQKTMSWKGVWCNTKEEGVVWKCICTCALFQWKMVEEPSCVLCEFIPLKYEER